MAIPKIIHYCWFGRNEKPKDVIKYIQSWKNILPDYDIVEWNEDNFDINTIPYTQEAYKEKKYAFVSDYARLYALHHHGGIYLDTDVEILKPFDDLLTNDLVLGFEEKGYIATSTICAAPHTSFIHEFMNMYHHLAFLTPEGNLDLTTNVLKITSILKKHGLIENEKEQTVEISASERVLVLDRLKFSPYDYLNQINHADKSTYAVHHFGASWASTRFKTTKIIKTFIIKLLGAKLFAKLHAALKLKEK